MKKFLLFLSIVVFAIAASAQKTYTITPTALTNNTMVYTSSPDQSYGITFTTAKNSGSTNPTYNTSAKDIRIYAKGSITVSIPSNIKASKIVFNISTQGKKRLAPITASAGTIAPQSSTDNTVVTWTGEVSNEIITFTVGDNADYGSEGSTKAGQLCFSSIELTVFDDSGEDPNPTKPENVTISCYPESPAVGSTTVTLSCKTEGADIFYKIDENGEETKYEEPFAVSESCTIYAYSEKDGEKSDEQILPIVIQKEENPGGTITTEISFGTAGVDGTDKVTYNKDYLTLIIAKGSGTSFNASYNPYRFYAKNTMTFSVPEGYEIKEIIVNTTSSNPLTCSASAGTLKDNGSSTVNWTANLDETVRELIITNTATKQAQISSIQITYEKIAPKAPEKPEITYTQEPGSSIVTISSTEGATIKYGFSEDAISSEYTAPFPVNESCTIYAYAEKDGLQSETTSEKIEVKSATQPKNVTISSVINENNDGATVTLNCETEGVTIKYGYSEDAITETYSDPFTVTENGKTIYAYAVNDKGEKSENTASVAVTAFIIPNPVTIEFTEDNVNFKSTVTLSCNTEKPESITAPLEIWYKINDGETQQYIEAFDVTEACSIIAFSKLGAQKSANSEPTQITVPDKNPPQTATIVFSELGYANAAEVTDVEKNGINLIFYGTGSNTPKYYNTGTGVRMYNNNTLTVNAPVGYEITEIKFTYSSESNTFKGTVSVDGASATDFTPSTTWSGNANKLVFTYTPSSGHCRIQKMEISYRHLPAPTEVIIESEIKNYEYTVTLSPNYADILYKVVKEGEDASSVEFSKYSEPFKVYDSSIIYACLADNQEETLKWEPITLNKINPVTVKSSELGYTNGQDVTDFMGIDNYEFTISCIKNSGNNAPKYYDEGNSVRLYNGNTMTISVPEGYEITNCKITYGNNSSLTSDWSGDKATDKITFSATATTYVSAIELYYQPIDLNRPENVEFKDKVIIENNKVKVEVTLSCKTEGAKIYYGYAPNNIKKEYTAPLKEQIDGTIIYAKAINNGSEGFTISFKVNVPTHYDSLKEAVEKSKDQPDENDVYVVGNFSIIYKHHKDNDPDHYLMITDGISNAVIYGYHNDGDVCGYHYNVGDNISVINGTLSHNPETGMFRFINAELTEGGEGAKAPETLINSENEATLLDLTTDNNLFDLVKIEGCNLRGFDGDSDGTLTLDDVTLQISNLFGLTDIKNQNNADVTGFVSKDKNDNILIIPTYVKPGTPIETAATPVFEPASKTALKVGDKITISCDSEQLVWIYYTISTDGTEPVDPTENSEMYDEDKGISFEKNCIIKAIAYPDNEGELLPSLVATASYTLYDPTVVETEVVTFDFTTCEGISLENGQMLKDNVTTSKEYNITNGKGSKGSISKDGISINFDQGTASTACRAWKFDDLRVYSGSNFTFSAPDGYFIKSIAFNNSTTSFTWNSEIGDYNNKIWNVKETCEPTEVTFNANGTCQLTKVTVTLAKPMGYFVWMLDGKKVSGNVTIEANPAGNNLALQFVDGNGKPIPDAEDNLKFDIDSDNDNMLLNRVDDVLIYDHTGLVNLEVSKLEYDGNYRYVKPQPLAIEIVKSKVEFSMPAIFEIEHKLAEFVEEEFEKEDGSRGHRMSEYDLTLNQNESFYPEIFDMEYNSANLNDDILDIEVTPLFTPLWGKNGEGVGEKDTEKMHKELHYYWYADPEAIIEHDELVIDASVAGKYQIRVFVKDKYKDLFEGEITVPFNLVPTVVKGHFYLSSLADGDGNRTHIGLDDSGYFFVEDLQDERLAKVHMYLEHKGPAWFKVDYKKTLDDDENIPTTRALAPSVLADEDGSSTDSKYPATPSIEVPAGYRPYNGNIDLRNAEALHILMNVNGLPVEHHATFTESSVLPVLTDVETIDVEDDTEVEYYTVEGIRIQRPTAKGIYVKRNNGKSGLFIVR